MKSAPLVTALIAAVVGGVSALAVNAIVAAPREAPRGRAGPVVSPVQARSESAPSGDEHTARIDELLLSNRALEDRVAELERAVASASRRAPLVAHDDEPEDAAPHAVDASSALDLPPEFVARVGDALDRIREDERLAAEARRVELQREKIEARLVHLSKELGLSGYQVDELRDVFVDRETRRDELLRIGKELDDNAGTKEGLRALYDETTERLAAILSREQLEEYQRTEGAREAKKYGAPSRAPDERSTRRSSERQRKGN